MMEDDLVSKLESLEAELEEEYKLQGERLAVVRRALAEARGARESSGAGWQPGRRRYWLGGCGARKRGIYGGGC